MLRVNQPRRLWRVRTAIAGFPCPSEKRAGQMPPLSEIIRSSDMITWNEQKPDFVRRSLNDLVCRLPFTRACAIVLAANRMPRVSVRQAVISGRDDGHGLVPQPRWPRCLL